LPLHLIAQEPCPERDQSRLLVVCRRDETIAHHVFHDLPQLLNPGDLLVLNDTKVIPARLLGRRANSGGRWEGLFLRSLADGSWTILCQTRGRLAEGETIVVEPGDLELLLLLKTAQGHWLVRPRHSENSSVDALELLEKHGQVPLPPYIRKGRARAADRLCYQTVYARAAGAVAAPTAGLHFTPMLLEELAKRGIQWTCVTLHVGLGTFHPIQAANIADHKMHRAWGEFSSTAAAAVAETRSRKGRIVAVRTTSVRVLETVAKPGRIRPLKGETEIYIYPPYTFQAVDAMITNFHLPRSTLLLLVSAFGGIELIRRAYKTAIDHEYRFYSYGDAMLIL